MKQVFNRLAISHSCVINIIVMKTVGLFECYFVPQTVFVVKLSLSDVTLA